MKPSFRKILSYMMAVAMISTNAIAQQTIKVRVDETTQVRTMGKDLLVSDIVLPAGTVLEVPVENYRRAEMMPYWGKDKTMQLPFVKGVRVLSAPGYSKQDLQELGSWAKVEGLYIAKKQLSNAVVVEGKETTNITIKTPIPLYRNDGPGAGVRPPAHPGARPQPKPEELDKDDVKKVVEEIQGANKSVGQTGRTQSACPACDANLYNKWVKAGVPARPLQLALEMYNKNPGGRIKNRRYVAFTDFTQHSKQKRMYILDMQTGEVSRHYTSNSTGERSLGRSGQMSNQNGSNRTPPGFHVTQSNGFHYGKHGKSLIMEGLERRNSNSAGRFIEIHEAPYASERFVRVNGYVGRSWGCLAIDPNEISTVLNQLKGGALVYNYNGE